MMLSKTFVKRLLAPVLFTVAFIGLAELVIQVRFSPSFWDRSAWLMHDPHHGGELFDRVNVYEKLSKLLAPDVKIISVGDSSGFFSLQPTIVNRYTHGLKYVNLSTGANQAFSGYKAIAQYALKTVPGIKYVVLYMYPQLVPSENLFAVADLAPILYENLVGFKSLIMPPSASLSAASKAAFFEGRRRRSSEPLSNHKVAIEFSETIDQTLGWVPEHDIRYDRVDGQNPFYPNLNTGWRSRYGLADPSVIVATFRDFHDMVKSYGAELVIVFAPLSNRVISPNDRATLIAIAADIEHFGRETPDVHIVTPFLTAFSPEKFAQFNHVAREYSHLSSARLGGVLQELILYPDRKPKLAPEFEPPAVYPPIKWAVNGPADKSLLDAAMAYFLYTATGDDSYRALISKRVLGIIDKEQPFGFAMHDTKERLAILASKNIKLSYDISQLDALPIDLSGMRHCGGGEGVQWAMLGGIVNYKIESPNFQRTEPVQWPMASKLFVPTIMEDGVRKFDGYCPESSLAGVLPRPN